MKTHILSILIASSLISNTFATPPSSGPNPGDNAQGLFATYFQNIANTSCTNTQIITGFDSTAGANYLKGNCTGIGGILGRFWDDMVMHQVGVLLYDFILAPENQSSELYEEVHEDELSGWSLTGNLNTNSSIHFIGTLDDTDVVFKRNNIEAGRLGDSTLKNTSWGTQALGRNTNGESNTAVGYSALSNNTIGSYNTALGNETLTYNTQGNYNTVIGNNALWSNRNGNLNTANGAGTLALNTQGSNNTALGGNALFSNTQGSNNTALGVNALFANTTANYNTAIGRDAGLGITIGSNNILLGYRAGKNITTGSKNIVIGYNIDAPLSSSNNTLNIGNLIYGTNIDGSDTTLSTGNIGIGVSSPSYKLHVSGTGSFSGFRLPTGAANGYVLTSDATGNARWERAGATSETDPLWTADKPLYALLASPTFSGNPRAPTQASSDNDTSIATTAFVKSQGYVTAASIPAETDPLWTSQKALYATLTSPAFIGTPTAPTQASSDNDTSIATTAFVKSQGYVTAASIPAETDPQVGTIADNAIPKMYGGTLSTSVINESSISNTIGINRPASSTTMLAMKYDISGGYGVSIQNSNPNGYSNIIFFDESGTDGANIGYNNAGNSLYFKAKNGDPMIFLTNNVEQMYLSPTGNLGIGMASGGEKLEIAGNAKAVGFLYSSDKRLKKDVSPLENIDTKLSALNGVNFTWKDSGRKDIGFIAREVEKILPELVHTGKDGMKSVEYANITALLVEGYKYQKQEAENQKARADNLEKRIEALENRIQ